MPSNLAPPFSPEADAASCPSACLAAGQTALAESPGATPKARGAADAWPTYELREGDIKTFLDVRSENGGRFGDTPSPAEVRRLLDSGTYAGPGCTRGLVMERRYFSVRRDGAPAGRLLAHLVAPEMGGPPIHGRGFFGLLAGQADPDAVRFLFDMASDWLGSRGCSSVVGSVRPNPDPSADPWISGVDEVPPAMDACLSELGFRVDSGASSYTCPVPADRTLARMVGHVPQPDGVAWSALDARAPWRGVQGRLAGERVAVAECSPADPPKSRSVRSAIARLRGLPPSGPVRLCRFQVAARLRDRGVGTHLGRELFVALRKAGIPSLSVGPLHDGHVAARRLLHRASAQRLRRISVYTLDL